MRGMRRVRLAQIDPRRVGVGRGDVVGGLVDWCGRVVVEDAVRSGADLGARQHDEGLRRRNLVAGAGLAVRTERPQRIVGLEWHEHGALALECLVEAVVEELAEEREHRVVRRRQSDVGRHVGDEQRLVRRNAPDRDTRDRRVSRRVGVRGARELARVALGAHREPCRGDRRWVGGRLIDDEVADRPRLGVDDGVAGRELVVARRTGPTHREGSGDRLGGAERRCRQVQEGHVGGGERLATGEQVVARAVDGAQPVGRQAVRDLVRRRTDERRARVVGRGGGRVALSDLDLLEDEAQVTRGDDEPVADRSRRRGGGRVHRRHRGQSDRSDGEADQCDLRTTASEPNEPISIRP